MAHTTVLIPQKDAAGRRTIRVLHFHPFSGSGLMGVRLGVADTQQLKGLAEIFLIHKGRRRDLAAVVQPDFYTVRGVCRESYAIPVDRRGGFAGAGTFALVFPRAGSWTLTLIDGDADRLVEGKKLEYDSSLTLLVENKTR